MVKTWRNISTTHCTQHLYKPSWAVTSLYQRDKTENGSEKYNLLLIGCSFTAVRGNVWILCICSNLQLFSSTRWKCFPVSDKTQHRYLKGENRMNISLCLICCYFVPDSLHPPPDNQCSCEMSPINHNYSCIWNHSLSSLEFSLCFHWLCREFYVENHIFCVRWQNQKISCGHYSSHSSYLVAVCTMHDGR